MTILKHGNPNPRRFVCSNCGCEFVAKSHEYFRTEKFGVVGYECDCPDCTDTSKMSEQWDEEHDKSGLVFTG
jgi:hypothetical protein